MYEYLLERVQTDTKFVGDSHIKIICSNINSVPEQLRKFAEVDIAMNVGKFKYNSEYGYATENGFLI
jgi:hypothetical protein